MEQQLAILRGLADRTRLKIVDMLFAGPHCVEEMTSLLKMSQPRVSRHLRILRESGLVVTRRDRRRIYYSLSESSEPAVAELLGFLESWLQGTPSETPSQRTPTRTASDLADRLPKPAVTDLEDFLL